MLSSFSKLNWNIRLAFIYSILSAVGFGIIQTAFSIYVTQVLGQSNLALGSLFTVSGLASTIFVFPSGYLADKYRRDILIRISTIFGVTAQLLVIHSLSIINRPTQAMLILLISQVLGGLSWGLSGPASQALIADSIAPGERSKIFSQLHFASMGSSATGPAVAALLTIIIGDTWDIGTLGVIITVGSSASLFSFIIFLFASDKKSLRSKTEDRMIINSSPILKQKEKRPSNGLKKMVGSFHQKFDYDIIIPLTIVISGVIIGFGAGATVAFFPVLFANPKIGYGLTPFFTYLIMAITSLVSGYMGIVAQKMSKIFGRIMTMIIVQGSAIICLLGIMFNIILYHQGTFFYELSVLLLAVLYIIRNALMNSSSPISRSIVMDVVPSKSRGKWNSMETLAWGMFWSISASIGGFIIDNFGFVFVFLFTATLYSLATLLLLVIKKRVPKESVLARPYRLNNISIKNRLVMPPTSIRDVHPADGQPTTNLIKTYENIAKGGVGLILIGPCYVSSDNKTTYFQLGIHEDYVIPRLKEVADKIKNHSCIAGIQLEYKYTRSYDLENEHVRQLYLSATQRAIKAGYQVIELVSLNDFDIDIIKEVKKLLPIDTLLSYKLSEEEISLDSEELQRFLEQIAKEGVNVLNINNLNYLKKIKKITSLPIIYTGFLEIFEAEQLVKQGFVDLVAFEKIIAEDNTFPHSLK